MKKTYSAEFATETQDAFYNILNMNHVKLVDVLLREGAKFPKNFNPFGYISSNWRMARLLLDHKISPGDKIGSQNERITRNLLTLEKKSKPMMDSLKSMCINVLFCNWSLDKLLRLPPHLIVILDEPLPPFHYLDYIPTKEPRDILKNLLQNLRESKIPFNTSSPSFEESFRVTINGCNLELSLVVRSRHFEIRTAHSQMKKGFFIDDVTQFANGYSFEEEHCFNMETLESILKSLKLTSDYAFPFVSLIYNYCFYKINRSVEFLVAPSMLRNEIMADQYVPLWYCQAIRAMGMTEHPAFHRRLK